MARRSFFAYLLRCGDGSYYAGCTTDPARRLAAHRQGRAARYTRGRGPFRLAAVWRCPSLGAALRLERLLKRLSHAAKRRLGRGDALAVLVAAPATLRVRRLRITPILIGSQRNQ